MAEVIAAVSAVASVIQLVQFSADILTAGYGFLAKVSRAPAELRQLLAESAGLNCILAQIQFLVESPNSPNDALQSLQQLGVFKECHDLLIVIKGSLDACQQEQGKDVRNFGRRLVWPLKERETKEAMQRLNRLRALLSTAVGTNSALALRRIESGQGIIRDEVTSISAELKNHLNRDEFAKIASWLCPSTSFTAQESLEAALRARHQGTGTWFLDSPIFHGWLTSQNDLLWITGLPGCGKTVLCSTIIDHLQRSLRAPSVAVLFFFCDYRDQNKKILKGFLMTLARQGAQQSDECFRQAQQIFEEKNKDSDRPLNTAEYISLVKTFLRTFEQVFVIIDALDEASEKGSIVEAVTDLLSLPQRSSDLKPRLVKVLLTSREDLQVRRILRSVPYLRLGLDESIHEDVELYVKMDIQSRILAGQLKLRNKDLASQICTTIISRAGTFLQAKLQLDMISSLKTDKAIRAALQILPSRLAATYENILLTTLKRHAVDIDEIKTTLQWLVASVTPLTASQLAEIVAISPEDPSLDFDGVSTDAEDVVEPISQLVILERYLDDTIVRFSHFSVEEYLCFDGIATSPTKDFYINLEEAHAKVAEICLQYLSFSDFDDPDLDGKANVFELMSKYTLLGYASVNWSTHLQKSNLSRVEYERRILPRLDWFLNADIRPSLFNNWQRIMKTVLPRWMASTHSPLLFAIRAGLHQIVDIMLPKLSNVNQQFPNGFTCLAAAATGNQVLIAKRLLQLGADVNMPTADRSLTPLHLAAENACVEMVELLLDKGASINSRSSSKTTPFYRAARGGSIEILHLLHQKGSEVDARTWDKWTPLMEAVENGHEPAIDLLLEWGADPNQQSTDGVSPLRLAQVLSHLSIERKLKAALKGQRKETTMADHDMIEFCTKDGDSSDDDSDVATVWRYY